MTRQPITQFDFLPHSAFPPATFASSVAPLRSFGIKAEHLKIIYILPLIRHYLVKRGSLPIAVNKHEVTAIEGNPEKRKQ